MNIDNNTNLFASGKWVTEHDYAQHFKLHPQTLANWRYHDRKAGRDGPKAGFPVYRRFGRSVRYWLPSEARQVA